MDGGQVKLKIKVFVCARLSNDFLKVKVRSESRRYSMWIKREGLEQVPFSEGSVCLKAGSLEVIRNRHCTGSEV